MKSTAITIHNKLIILKRNLKDLSKSSITPYNLKCYFATQRKIDEHQTLYNELIK